MIQSRFKHIFWNLMAVSVLAVHDDGVWAQMPQSTADLPPSPAPVGTTADSPLSETFHNSRAAEHWRDQPLGKLKASISLNLPDSEKLTPTEVVRLSQATPILAAAGNYPLRLGDSRPWMLSTYEWEAPATRHLPLMFEEPNLERLGYTPAYRIIRGDQEWTIHSPDCVQPLVSGLHFFGRVPFIPYMMGVDNPCVPIYTLGVDRPGSPVPYRRQYVALSLKGAVYQAAATVGMVYLLP